MSGARVDVLILTALKDELDAVLQLEIDGRGRKAWRDTFDQSDFPYHVRELSNAHGEKLRVAAAWTGRQGESAAAQRAEGLIQEVDPACLAICGICAGWRGKVSLGDVIVAEVAAGYEPDKQGATRGADSLAAFRSTFRHTLEAKWKTQATHFALEFLRAPRLTKEHSRSFQVHVAPIITGGIVREGPELFNRLSRFIPRVLGAETHARAIGQVADQLGRRRSIVVKAVSDYADHEKDDAFRPFACHVSAAFLLAFLQKHLRLESSPQVQAPALSHEERQALEPREAGAVGDPYDGFLAHVERICALRHPEGTKITRQKAPPPFTAFLEVAVKQEGFERTFPVAAIGQPMTEEILQAFLKEALTPYERKFSAVNSTLVHGGPPASQELTRKALSRRVWLTSLGEYQALFDFSAYLQRQTARLESDPVHPPALYMEQSAQVGIGGQEATPTNDALSSLREMLDSPHPGFALVLGEAGMGKTFLLHELARRMASAPAAVVPVVIQLRSLLKHRSLKELIAHHFAAAEVGRLELDRFLYMLQEGRIALLFDGFDELALRITYEQMMEHFGMLLEAAQGRAKVIVTSTPRHFLGDHGIKRELGARAAMLPGFRLIHLTPFSQEQAHQFLVKRLGEAAADERMALMREAPEWLSLSENPLLLGFIAELDVEALRAARASSGEMTSAKLHGLRINRWLQSEHYRVILSGAPEGFSVQQLRRWTAELARLLWERTEGSVHLSELPTAWSAAIKGRFPGSGSLLARDEEGRFSFIHSSVLEWWVAAAAAGSVRGGEEATLLGRWQMSDLMADFFIDLGGREAAGRWVEATLGSGKSQMAQRNALRVAQRLRETGVDQCAALETPGVRDLEGRDLRGEELSSADLRGARLDGAELSGVTLEKARLTGARLHRATLVRANLDHAVLAEADLTEADLSGARLLGADLSGTKLQGARMHAARLVGARIGSLEGVDLFGAAPPEPVRFTPNLGLASSLHAVAFHPAGQFLATAHTDGTIRLWEVETGQAVRVLRAGTGAILSVAFSPDGRTMATGSADRTVRLWNVEQGELLRTLQGHTDPVWGVAFSPDGRMLASCSEDATVRFWSPDRDEHLRIVRSRGGYVRCVAFSPDGGMLASGCKDGATYVLDAKRLGEILGVFQGHAGHVKSVAFSPDGRTLASCSRDGSVSLWLMGSAKSWAFLHSFKGHTQPMRSLAFSPDGRTLAACSDDGVVRCWSVGTGTLLRTLQGVTESLRSLAFSPDGRTLALGSAGGIVRLWSLEHGRFLRALQGPAAHVRAMAVSPDARTLASISEEGTLRLWDMERGASPLILQEAPRDALSLAFSPDGRLLAAGSASGPIWLWSLEQGAPLRTLPGQARGVRSVVFSPDGRTLSSVSADGTIGLWDVEHARPLSTLLEPTADVRSVALSQDGLTRASGAADGSIRLWEVEQEASPRILKEHSADVRSVAFSRDGRMLASGSDDGTVRLWSVEQGAPVHILHGHAFPVESVAFDQEGTLLVSSSRDGTARFWDPSTGSHLATILGYRDGWVAFRPDGRFKSEGTLPDACWHSIGLCRFELGELDPYLPTPLRLPDDEPLLPGAANY